MAAIAGVFAAWLVLSSASPFEARPFAYAAPGLDRAPAPLALSADALGGEVAAGALHASLVVEATPLSATLGPVGPAVGRATPAIMVTAANTGLAGSNAQARFTLSAAFSLTTR
jgi:hypothetical protein